jgi:hypothetical protein
MNNYNYYFQFYINNSFYNLDVENIKSFNISNINYKINSFKSIKKYHDFLIENNKKLTYIKFTQVHFNLNYKYIEFYLKISENIEKSENIASSRYFIKYIFHRLDGPAYIMYLPNLSSQYYYIDGINIDEENYNKHPKIREIKLKKNIKYII